PHPKPTTGLFSHTSTAWPHSISRVTRLVERLEPRSARNVTAPAVQLCDEDGDRRSTAASPIAPVSQSERTMLARRPPPSAAMPPSSRIDVREERRRWDDP